MIEIEKKSGGKESVNMLNWFTENLSTIIVSLVLVLIVAAIIRKLVRDKKKGKSSCGCNCAHCAMAGSCHKTE